MTRRAERRAHTERLIKKLAKRELNGRYEHPAPHFYFAYDLDVPEDFLEFLAINDEDFRRNAIYVIGKGHINPKTFTDWHGHTYQIPVPPFDKLESRKNAFKTARYSVNTRQPCHRMCCSNPRREMKRKTRKEYMNYIDYKEQCEELNIQVHREGRGFRGW